MLAPQSTTPDTILVKWDSTAPQVVARGDQGLIIDQHARCVDAPQRAERDRAQPCRAERVGCESGDVDVDGLAGGDGCRVRGRPERLDRHDDAALACAPA